MRKKLFSILLSAIVLLSMTTTVFAAGGTSISDWRNLPGYDYINNNSTNNKDGKLHPLAIQYNSTGLDLRCDGYYKVGNPNASGYSGIILNDPINVDTDGFSIKFTVNQFGGVESDDCWVGFSLLDKANMWDNNSAANGAGMVTIFRPLGGDGKGGANLMMYQLTTTQPIRNGYEKVNSYYDGSDNPLADMSKTITFEAKKDATGNYVISINGAQITTSTFDELPWAVKNGGDGKAYLCFSVSTNASKFWDVTVKQINGVNLASTTSATSSISSSVSSSTVASNVNQSQASSASNTSKSNTPSTNTSSTNTSNKTQSSVVSGSSQTTVNNASNSTDNSTINSDVSGTSVAVNASTSKAAGKSNKSIMIYVIVGAAIVILCGGGFVFYIKKSH